MKRRTNQQLFKRAGICFCAIAVICFLICVGGLLWLYWTGFPSHAMVPRPITAALIGTSVYGLLGVMFLTMSKPRPPSGGKRGKVASLPKFGHWSQQTI